MNICCPTWVWQRQTPPKIGIVGAWCCHAHFHSHGSLPANGRSVIARFAAANKDAAFSVSNNHLSTAVMERRAFGQQLMPALL